MSKTINNSNLAIWREHVKACEASGLSINHWCRENAVKSSTYHYWLKKLNSQESKSEMEWGEIKIASEVKAEILKPIVVHFHDAIIEIPVGFDKATMVEVLSAISSLC